MTKPIIQAAKDNNIQLVEKLLKENSSCITDIDEGGMTAIMWASNNGLEDILLKLVPFAKEQSVDINQATTVSQMTALLLAASNDHNKVIEELLKNPGIKPNYTNSNGFSALMLAAKLGHKDCVELLAKVSNLSIKDNIAKKTAKDWASNDEIILLLSRQSEQAIMKM